MNGHTGTAELYRGRLDDFIRRRDALAKELRAAGDRVGAARIKSLRKPSRTAWALNLAADGEPLRDVVAAVHATIGAQSAGGDVRKAMAVLRDAVRAFATRAAAAATAEGGGVEASTLATSLLAILAYPESFDRLQRGELCDVPAAGGLDFLTTLSVPVTPAISLHRSENGATDRADATQAVERAELHVAERRKTADDALRALNRAESELDIAKRRVEEAKDAVATATSKRDAARAKTGEASALMRDAQDALAEARGALHTN